MVQLEVVRDRHQDIARPRSNPFRCNFFTGLQIELVKLAACCSAPGMLLGKSEKDVKQKSKRNSGDGSDFLGEEVDNRGCKQRQRNQPKAKWKFQPLQPWVQWYTEFARSRPGEAEDQYAQTLHGETPDHSESIRFTEEDDVAAAEEYGQELQGDHQVDDPVGSPEARMRLPEPVRQNAVFRNAIKNSVGAYYGRVDRARKDHDPHEHHEAVEQQATRERSHHIHRQAADKVVLIAEACVGIGNNHEGKEGDQRREHHAVNEDDKSGFLQVRQLWMLNFAVHLGQGFEAAHGQDGMAKGHQNSDDADDFRQPAVAQPSLGG